MPKLIKTQDDAGFLTLGSIIAAVIVTSSVSWLFTSPEIGVIGGSPLWLLGLYFAIKWIIMIDNDIGQGRATKQNYKDYRRTQGGSMPSQYSPHRRSHDYTESHLEHHQPERTSKHIYPTNKGDWVRSQDEAVIADTLWKLGIEYDYERPLRHPSMYEMKLPDFTISHRGKIYFWEHLGMMDDAEYYQRWENTKSWYESAGFGNQLITSQPDSSRRVDPHEIEEIVKSKIMKY